MKNNNDFLRNNARIIVIGIGGGGGNAVNHMFRKKVRGVEFYIVNTDQQILNVSPLDESQRIPIGPKLTNGLGAGGDPEIGKNAAIESKKELRSIIKGADMVFLSAGMGGGSGTGAISEIAKIAKEEGALTVACATEPFTFEGRKRKKVAEEGIQELYKNVDSLILVSNDNLLKILGRKPIREAFSLCDDVLKECVSSISELITVPALINLDFADVKSVLLNRGKAFFGIGYANGKEDVAIKAATNAIESPLLKHGLKGAKAAIVSIVGGPEMTLFDSEDAIRTIEEAASGPLEVIYGVSIDNELKDGIAITLVATGYDDEEEVAKPIKKDTTPLSVPESLSPIFSTPIAKEEPDFYPETINAARRASNMLFDTEDVSKPIIEPPKEKTPKFFRTFKSFML